MFQGATVWEVEASSSEEKVQILERPAAKARPTPEASEPFDRSASSAQRASSSSSSVVPQAKPCPSSESRVPKAKSRPSIVDHNSQGHVQSQLRRQSRES